MVGDCQLVLPFDPSINIAYDGCNAYTCVIPIPAYLSTESGSFLAPLLSKYLKKCVVLNQAFGPYKFRCVKQRSSHADHRSDTECLPSLYVRRPNLSQCPSLSLLLFPIFIHAPSYQGSSRVINVKHDYTIRHTLLGHTRKKKTRASKNTNTDKKTLVLKGHVSETFVNCIRL